MSKLSIVVPVYNVEKYLERCINSLVAQTFSDYEIILVDDGSTDNSGKICDQFAKLNNKIKVIHKENGGLSSARNAGIDIATGKYIGFVDSDDWIEPDMYYNLYNAAVEHDLDMVICGVALNFEDGSSTIYYSTENFKVFKKEEALRAIFVDSLFYEEAWNKIYSRHIFDTVRYPIGKIHEDTFVICEILDRCNNIGYIPNVDYHYFQRNDSIMGTLRKIPSNDKIESIERVLTLLRKYEEIYIDSFYNLISAPLKNIDSIIDSSSDAATTYMHLLKNFYKKFKKDIFLSRNTPAAVKVLILIILLPDKLSKFSYKLLRRLYFGKKK